MNALRRVQLPRVEQTSEQKMAHIVERFAPGGIESLVHDIASIDPLTFVISLSGRKEALIEGWQRAAEIEPRVRALDRPARLNPNTFLRLSRLLRDLGVSTVVAHHIGPLLYGGLAAKLASIPVIYIEHDAWHYAQHGRHERILRGVVSLVQPALCAVSQPVAKNLEVLTGRQVSVLPPGVCCESFQPRHRATARHLLGLPQRGKLIGAIGRLEAVKGHKHLIGALAKLGRDVSLAIAGDGAERPALAAQVQRLGLSDRVYFLGHREKVCALYPAFDVFCQPSLAEGLPRTVLEAQASGIPVVAADVGSVSFALEPDSSLLVAAADEAALADALHTALRRPVDPSKIRQFVVDHFSLDATISILNRLSGAWR